MINLIRMEVYRMFRTLSMWVLWGILVFAIVFTTYIAELDKKSMTAESTEPVLEEMQMEQLNLGMSVTLPTKAGETTVTLYDMVYANFQGKFIALFIAIFAVLFSTADMNSGYIKNIGGQIAKRHNLILAKIVALCLYTILTLVLYIAVQAVSNRIFFGSFAIGETGLFVRYLCAETALHVALAIICMVLAILIRNNLITMILAICLCMNVMVVIYQILNRLIEKISGKEVQILDYTISSKISLLSMNPGNEDVLRTIMLALVYIMIMTVTGCVIFRKRDIA
ncbi:MAG: ABC transporter permease [Lachnospiraceae bacterium]